jgi:hypothetical protein
MSSRHPRLGLLAALAIAAVCGTGHLADAGGLGHRGAACCDQPGCPPRGHGFHHGHGRACGHCATPRCHGDCCPPRCGAGLCDGNGHHALKHDTIEKRYFLRSQGKSWHSAWYDPSIGRPMALVVPPTAEFMTEYSWGVPSSRVMPLYHQFRRPYPGAGAVPGAGGFMPTPNQPSDTVQFGVHPVRGPWGAY